MFFNKVRPPAIPPIIAPAIAPDVAPPNESPPPIGFTGANDPSTPPAIAQLPASVAYFPIACLPVINLLEARRSIAEPSAVRIASAFSPALNSLLNIPIIYSFMVSHSS